MAALGRLDDLEDFLMDLQPEDAFRPRAVWQFPGGLHDYTLPTTVADRIGSPVELGTAARGVRDRARRLRDRRERLPRSRRGARLRARVRVSLDRARGDGPRDPRVGRDQRARSADRRSTVGSRPTAAGYATSRSSTRTATRTSPRSRHFATSRATRRRTRRSSSVRRSVSSDSARFLRCEPSWLRFAWHRSARHAVSRLTTAS